MGRYYILRIYFISWLSRTLNCRKQWPKKQKIWHHFHALYSQQIFSHILIISWLYLVISWLYTVISWLYHVISWLYIVLRYLYPVISWSYPVISWLNCSNLDLRVHDLSVPCYPKPCMLRQNLHHLKMAKVQSCTNNIDVTCT